MKSLVDIPPSLAIQKAPSALIGLKSFSVLSVGQVALACINQHRRPEKQVVKKPTQGER